MKIKKFYIDKNLLFCLIIFSCISFLSIYSATKLLASSYQNLVWKQVLWYGLGILSILFILFIGNKKILESIWYFYGLGIISLTGLLFFAPRINDARCWYFIPGIGGIQPSEFMKIILILVLAKMIEKFHTNYPKATVKQEFLFLCKVILVIFIPSFLTFLQPDTGVVLIYLLITITMLFIGGIRYRWFTILGSIFLIGIGSLLILYFFYQETFVNLFGSSFFLRIERLLNWSNSSGYQLENGKTSIASAGLWGFGFGNTPLYFPEPQTDFIFAVYANNTGFIGSLFLISFLIYFDYQLIKLARKTKKFIYKYIIAGVLGMLLYQQVQNIGMTIGLLPITGITLPFISYGGSSLISYFLILGIIFNIKGEQKNQNK